MKKPWLLFANLPKLSGNIIRWLRIGIISLSSIVAILSLTYGGLLLAYQEKVLPRVVVANLSVTGLTHEQVSQKIAPLIQDFKDRAVEVVFEDQRWTEKVADLGYQVDEGATVQAALAAGRDPNFLTSLGQLTRNLLFSQTIWPVVRYDREKIVGFASEIAKELDQPAHDAAIVIKKGAVQTQKSLVGRQIDQESLVSQIISQLTQSSIEPIEIERRLVEPKIYEEGLTEAIERAQVLLDNALTLKVNDGQKNFELNRELIGTWLTSRPSNHRLPGGRGYFAELVFDQDKVVAYVKTLAKQIDQPVKEAKLKIVESRAEVFQASQAGLKVNQKAAVEMIVQALEQGEQVVALPIEVTKPNVTIATINDLGINEVVGQATTSFKGSPQNRRHNIGNGAGTLNGVLIAPGATFSVLENLGKIDDTTGYLPELVIKENRTIPEFGGGLCQVSTTLFRAALNAGLPIVERKNHSWRISYYEPPVGLDATIFLAPNIDLKFTNNTPGWLLIQSEVKENQLAFTFFGTSDGRRSEVSTKVLSSTPAPPAEYLETNTLARGETKQVEKPHPGGRAVATYKVYDQGGQLINDQTFHSSYKAVPARFLVGTAESAPAPTEEQSSEPLATESQ